jgi:hypothetical protein
MTRKKAAQTSREAAPPPDEATDRLLELLRGGGRVRGALLAGGEPLAEAALSRGVTGGFLVSHPMAAQADVEVEAVRLTAEVAVQEEGSDQTSVQRLEADVPLPAPRRFLAGEPLSVVLPNAPGFRAPEPPREAEEHERIAGGAVVEPRPDDDGRAAQTQAATEAGATG